MASAGTGTAARTHSPSSGAAPAALNQSHGVRRVQVEEVATAWLGHQQHYSNFYHMFSEVAPSIHSILCKHLKDCTYSATGGCDGRQREEGWGMQRRL